LGLVLAVDFGSTYTKVAAFDLNNEKLVGVARSATTVETDITIGLEKALEALRETIGTEELKIERTFSSSSAAGGLRMVVAGFTNELTTRAAREAALGAGAKVVGTYPNGISSGDCKEIEQTAPDLILLTGGTDGGNKQVVLHNAAVLAKSKLDVPFIIAGNKMASDEAFELLSQAGKYAVVTENVLPELDVLNIEPTRSAIREVFMRRITLAKGLEKAQAIASEPIMPTPLAVLKGAALLAAGAEGEEGFGDLMVVDVGGATTDVISISHGRPTISHTVVKGIAEPYDKRTVEGDLGIRYNAASILEVAGLDMVGKKMRLISDEVPEPAILQKMAENLSGHVNHIPENETDRLMDAGLASTAVDIATRRHAGTVEEAYFPSGTVRIQRGKDLAEVQCVIGTGGIFAYNDKQLNILQSACFDPNFPESLRPLSPDCYVDESYILYALGLLAQFAPVKALKIIKRLLKVVV